MTTFASYVIGYRNDYIADIIVITQCSKAVSMAIPLSHSKEPAPKINPEFNIIYTVQISSESEVSVNCKV